MKSRQMILGWTLVCLISTSSFVPVLAYPNVAIQGPSDESSGPQYEQFTPQDAVHDARKFAEKPNSIKKIQALEDRNDLDDLSTNNITDGGFSWSNMIAMFMQMLFNPAGGSHNGPNKSESLDTDTGVAPSPWANLLTVGLKILSAFLGGAGGGDGIDKVDNSSPMQFINIVVNLLDALKTSFSHRSMTARSLGKKDSVSEAAVASLAVFKGYMRTMRTTDESCMMRYMCDANRECAADTNGSSSIYCQLGTYLASFMLQRSGAPTPMENYYEAGRRGRTGEDCHQLYVTCNEV